MRSSADLPWPVGSFEYQVRRCLVYQEVGVPAEVAADGVAVPIRMLVVELDDHQRGSVPRVVEGVPHVEFGALDVEAEQVDLVDAPLREQVFQWAALDENLAVVSAAAVQSGPGGLVGVHAERPQAGVGRH